MKSAFENLRNQAGGAPDDIRALYDDWAGEYDRTLEAWGYEAPAVAAAYLRDLVPLDAFVLDAGCGTGLTGAALKRAGFSNIVGVDFSEDSLALAAERGVYSNTLPVDLTQPPVPLGAGAFGAVVCIGVLSYLPEIEGVCREFCRLTRAGGIIVLTQRSDLFDARNTRQVFDTLSAEGLWREVEVTGPKPYLPGNSEFEGVDVHYCVFRRC